MSVLKENGFITDDSVLCEQGNRTTFETRLLRSKAATEKISLDELARVLIMITRSVVIKVVEKLILVKKAVLLMVWLLLANSMMNTLLLVNMFINCYAKARNIFPTFILQT